jgi:glycosyltransferase involved in cell wall biosynthesis
MTSDRPLKLAYLMEDTDLSGGVRVQLAQSDALIARGHEVVIFTKGLPLTWRRSRAEWRYVDTFDAIDAAEFDFVVGTFWTTVPAAYAAAGERAVHQCQGYEGSIVQYTAVKSQIDAAYALPIPKLVVTPYLVDTLKPFGVEVEYIGQIVDEEFFRDGSPRENDPLRLLFVGASQVEVKGIDVGYGAIAHAKWHGGVFDVVRVSPWAPSQEEPLEHVREFHVALSTDQMVKLVHSCDLALVSSRRTEGFGLPAAEAMAASLPTVLTRIPSFLSFGTPHDFAQFAPEDDPMALGDALMEVLEDDDLRHKLARSGRRVVDQFRPNFVAERMERYLLGRRERLGVRLR